MFAHVLAVLLGLGSLVFYIAAFVYPEVHRRSDFLWGGLGLLYSAVLWFGAGQMTGLVLLGQMVAVVLLLGLGWQTLTVRREKTPVYQQTPIVLTPEVVGGWAKSKLNELRIVPDENVRPVRLERRAIEGSAVLDARLDPRRRPAYDYEFVEDGVGADEVQQGELFAIAFAEETEFSEGLDEAATDDLDRAVPPSAEAEVVAVEPASEEAVFEEAVSEASAVEEAALEEDVAEEVIPQEVVFAEAVAEAPSLEESTAEEPIANEPVAEELIVDEAIAEQIIADDADSALVDAEPDPEFEFRSEDSDSEWSEQMDDDLAIANETQETSNAQWIDEVPVAASQPKALSEAANKKPNLLAMPIILAGWVKDVVVSFTKPKPSKPMIEIPRREASVSRGPVRDRAIDEPPVASRSAEGDSRYNDDLEDDDWEDSNWAD